MATRAIVALAVVAVCVIAARWYVLERLQGMKERALEAAEQALDCDIRVGRIRSEAIDTFVIEDVDVSARDEGDNGHVASIPLVRVSIDLPHLIRGGVRARAGCSGAVRIGWVASQGAAFSILLPGIEGVRRSRALGKCLYAGTRGLSWVSFRQRGC